MSNMVEKKKILFNTQFVWPFAAVDYTLAMGLQQRGHEVLMLACGGGLPCYCELEAVNQARPDCTACLQTISEEFTKYGLPYTTVKEYLKTEDYVLANRLVEELSVDDLLGYKLLGVPVGRLARLNLFQYYHGFPFSLKGEKEGTFRRAFHSAVLYTLAKKRVFDLYQPDIVVTVNGKFLQWAPLVYFAKEKGCKYVTWEDLGLISSGIALAVNDIAHEQRIDEVWPEESQKELNEEQRTELKKHFRLWADGEIATFKYYGEDTEFNQDNIRKQLDLKPDRPIISLFPNVNWDSTSVGFENAFDSMYDWIFSCVDYAVSHPQIDLIMRSHPAELKVPDFFKNEVLTCDVIRKKYGKLPDNVKLINPDSNISSYAIADMSNVCMVYTSTMGIELALQGKKVWVAANAYYSGKGFTVDLKSKEHMVGLLDQRLFDNALTPDQIKLAEKFAHIVRLRRVFSAPYVDAKKHRFNFPGREAFAPGGNPVVENMCSYVLTGLPFIDIGHIKPIVHPLSQPGNAGTAKEEGSEYIYNNLKIKYDSFSALQTEIKNIFEQKIYDFKTDKKSPLVIDGGAHIGTFSLYVKQHYPQARIIAFEPDQCAFDLLNANLADNHCQQVHTVKNGLFNQNTVLRFASNGADGGAIKAEGSQEIQVVKLSDYIREEVDYLKLNIEGAELEVLEEIEPKLHLVKEICLEYHGFPEIGQRLHQLLDLLDRNGFRYLIHDFDKETNPATKPPFHINTKTKFFLLIYAKKIYTGVNMQSRGLPKEYKREKDANEEIIWLRQSRLDMNGRVFKKGGKIFRAMKNSADFYERLLTVIRSNKVLKETIIETRLCDETIPKYKSILEHKKINLVTYPGDWSYSMFKDALIAHLNVHIELLSNGYTLQDAHLWNVTFDGSSPKLIDFGSIIEYRNNIAESKKEYLNYCITPLFLMALGYFDKAKRYLTHSTPYLAEEDVYGYINKHKDSITVKQYFEMIKVFSRTAADSGEFKAELSRVCEIVKAFNYESESIWSVYHKAEEGGQSHNKVIELENFLKGRQNLNVLDVGCASGFYSLLAAQYGHSVVATEIDMAALDYTYNKAKAKKLNITPLLRNLMEVKADLSGNKYDVVIANAIIHHLAFTQRLSLEEIIDKLSEYCRQYLFIEYISEGDPFVKKNISNYQFEYSYDKLKSSLDVHFDIVSVFPSTSDNRKLILCRIKDKVSLPNPDSQYSLNLVSRKSDFGSLRRLQPVSRVFGSDRMTDKSLPLCWYYIRQFLAGHAGDIRGRVLEIGDNTYTRMFGGKRVTKSDILHAVAGNKAATIVADLTKADNIPSDTFDCIICTQTLQCIYDVRAAIKNLYRILKPGGVLLVTGSGISQISRYDMDRWGEYWKFTTASFKKMFEEYWPSESIEVKSYGNVLVAMSYLQGLVSGDLDENEMNYHDDDYQMMIVGRAVKPVNVTRNIPDCLPQVGSIQSYNQPRNDLQNSAKIETDEVRLIADGWDQYAKEWKSNKFKVLSGHQVKNIGDEWTAEDVGDGGTTYGLPKDIVDRFDEYMNKILLNPYLPSLADEGLEIGPGGGRLTNLLIPRTKVLHLADSSETMLEKLKERFSDRTNLRYYHTDGMSLPPLKKASLDYVVAFDVFVHFEPRLVYWYLRQISQLLKPGGVCIIHYANAITEIGWRQFESDLKMNVKRRDCFSSFGTMCPQLMEKFLKSLGFEIRSVDIGIIPRDAVAVFSKPVGVPAFHKTVDARDNNARVVQAVQASKTLQSMAEDAEAKTNESLKAPLVLLYHRVAEDPIDSQLLAVSPENFESHLKELSANYRVLPLHQLLGQASRGQLQPNTVAITFDDGYLDNLTNAVPLLEKYGLPATVFVTSGVVDTQEEFWWDALEQIFLTGQPLPDSLNISNAQGTAQLSLTGAENRLAAYDKICGMVRNLPFANIHKIVDQLFIWAKRNPVGRATHRSVNPDQLRILASSPAIEIGSHTVTHTRLSVLSPQQQRQEIHDSKYRLESLINKPVRLFSYPYGTASDFTKETARIAKEEGFEAAIANIQRNVVAPVDLYAVPRRLVRNWSAHQFSQWLLDENKEQLEAQTISGRARRIAEVLKSPQSVLCSQRNKNTAQCQC